ncbi:hypothetical protein TWF281_000007 [Arthrobotrys megalospora]
MQITSSLLLLCAGAAGANACYWNARSSTAGTWRVQHSEPKDHGGQRQTLTASRGSCRFTANVQDGCRLTVTSSSGCGTLTFQNLPEQKRDVGTFAKEFTA